MQNTRPTRRFTGHHMAAILISFFAIVIAVNVTMARYATSTFGGTVVDNSYVASQKFNRWLAEARREKALGWAVSAPTRDESSHIVLRLKGAGGEPLGGAGLTVRAEHPLGRAPDQALRFIETAPGAYRSTGPLPNGRWKLRIHITRGADTLDIAGEVY